MISTYSQPNTSISKPKLYFQGAETFKKRIERDELFTQEDLPDFELISSKDTRKLLKDQVDFAKSSQQKFEMIKSGTIWSRKLWENAFKKNDVDNAEAVLTKTGIKELEEAGISLESNTSPDEISFLQGKYHSHNRDEELGLNYGVGELSDKAVKLLKEYKTNPDSFKSQRSFFSHISESILNFWRKIKSWFRSNTKDKS